MTVHELFDKLDPGISVWIEWPGCMEPDYYSRAENIEPLHYGREIDYITIASSIEEDNRPAVCLECTGKGEE